jgi:sugar phosphate isomerase/epimerase
MMMINRRRFIARSTAVFSTALGCINASGEDSITGGLNSHPGLATTGRLKGKRLKLGLNAFTFNRELISGRMTMKDVIDFCAEHDVDGVDMTGYYFPGYPEVCGDSVILELKRYAFVNGVTISGTGVRNSFTTANDDQLAADVQHTKDWIDVAAKLGSDVLRVFSGRRMKPGLDRQKAQQRLVQSLKACALYGKEKGVVIALQHHHDFLETADQTLEVLRAVNSPWCGLVLDIGSLRIKNVYQEIEQLLPYATTWQVKEHVWSDGEQSPVDLERLAEIIDRVGYRGFLPIEVLGEDSDVDQRKKHAARFLEQVRDRVMG